MKVKVMDVVSFIKDHNLSPRCQTEIEAAAMTDAIVAGVDSVEMPENYWASLVQRDTAIKEKQNKWDSEYKSISMHRVAGMEREADGDIDAAIDEYAESIALGLAAENDMLHAFHHSFNRIFVLLDKVKRYAEEADYIEKLLSFNLNDTERGKLIARLEKVNVKLEKQSRNG